MKNNIGDKLKKLRTHLELTQGDFATEIGMKQSAYSMIENGKNKLGIDALETIIDRFKIDANYFFRNIDINDNRNDIVDDNIMIENNDNIIRYDKIRFAKDYDKLVTCVITLSGLILRHGDSDYITLEMLNDLRKYEEFNLSKFLDIAFDSTIDDKMQAVNEIMPRIEHLFPKVVEDTSDLVNVLGVTLYNSKYNKSSFIHFEIDELEEEIRENNLD